MRRSRFPLVVTALVMAFFYLPVLILVANSFNPARFSSRWQGFSLVWYRRLFESPEIWQALKNTLIIAISVTAVAAVLGTAAAYALHRYGASRLQKVHYTLIYQPLVVPEILMGISLLMAFVAAGVPLGLFTIFLAHVTFCVSFVAMTVLGRLQDFDFSIIEAARDLGASPWQSTRKVLLPVLMPGIVAGALLAFTLSIDDFVITFFVAGPGSTTLPLRIYSMIKYGAPPMINALSTLLLAVTFAAVLASQRLARRRIDSVTNN
ncbi:MAG: spermidine/putrescine ABC transporter permease [Candidatus Aminicenantes bacterium RBG_16_63_16]|nr:MAG: spermidine/putrescine ABC transporter permease [Candidatus Aminicenantes bacterium RBG_16_63_16]